MFWESMLGGLSVLTYWETYIAGLGYLAIYLVPMLVVGIMMQRNAEAEGLAGCLTVLLLPILQVAGMAVFVLTLFPIIFGIADDAAWEFPWQVIVNAPGAFFRLVGILVLTAVLLAFVPFLGQLQSLQTLVLGGIALVVMIGVIDASAPGSISQSVSIYPGFWFCVGLVVIGGLMSFIGTMAAALLVSGLEIATPGLGQLIMFPIAAIFGFIPVFMYGAWLGSQL